MYAPRAVLRRALPLVALLAAASPARADEPPPPPPPSAPPPAPPANAAAEAKARGDAAMKKLEYELALREYEDAYKLGKDPAVLYNMGRAYQGLTRYPESLDKLEAFAREASADVRAKVPKLVELLAEVRAKVSTLAIRSNVRAKILLRSARIGEAPLVAFRTNAGTATLEVEADGYRPVKREITLPGGGTLDLEINLLPLKDSGTLAIRANVEGATVVVDGEGAGQTPTELVVKAGEHTILLKKTGYDDLRTKAVVLADENKVLDLKLQKSAGFFEQPWFWLGLGVATGGGVALTIALLTERPPDSGDIPPGQVSSPLRRSQQSLVVVPPILIPVARF